MDKEKVWLVTGASKGLGLILVKKILNKGYRVAVFFTTDGASVLIHSGRSNFILNSSMEWSSLTNKETLPNEAAISKNYTNFLPSFIWRWRIDKSKNLRVNIRTNTSIPRITQLQEVLDNSNPLNQYIGNGISINKSKPMLVYVIHLQMQKHYIIFTF